MIEMAENSMYPVNANHIGILSLTNTSLRLRSRGCCCFWISEIETAVNITNQMWLALVIKVVLYLLGTC